MEAIQTHIAEPLGLDVLAAASGIVEVVNHSMADALRIVSVERGYDPREFSLVAFGGAGPVHAAALADELDIGEIIIPPIPGGFSALGLVTTDLRRDYSRTYYATIATADPKGMVPPNSGVWRPVEVRAPKATVVNAQFPAPVVYANHEISHRVCDMVFGALANVIPEQVMACSQGTSAVLTLGGVDYRSGERYVSYETIKGGFGARPAKDGINAVASGISNTMNTPIRCWR